MATRFRLTSNTTAPGITVSTAGYTHDSGVRRILKTEPDGSALTTTAYTPDSSDHLVAGDSLLVQFISGNLGAGVTFTNGDTIKCALQFLEANANNNLSVQIYVSVVDSTGGTVRRILRSKTGNGTEVNTSIRSIFTTTTQDGATYTTVDGDCLVVEISLTGTPVQTSGTQGHNGSARWGCAGISGDVPENNTDTSTTDNPWIEFVPTIYPATPKIYGFTAKNQSGGGTTIALTKPLGLANGDELLVYVYVTPDAGASRGHVTASGWTEVAYFEDAGQTNANALMRRITDGSEGASITFTTSGGGASIFNGIILAIRKNNTTTPEDQTSTGNDGSGSNNVVAPSITTQTDNALHICFFETVSSQTGYSSAPGGYQQNLPFNFGSNGDFGFVASKTIASHGTTGTQTAVATGTAGAWITISYAVRPPTAGNVTVSPSKASLLTSLKTPVVKTPRRIVPTLVALATSLKTPVAKVNTLARPTKASLTTSFKTPVVRTPRRIIPTLATLATSLKIPVVKIGKNIFPSEATLTTSLKTPVVRVNTLVRPTKASLAVSLKTPVVKAGVSVTPSKASLVTSLKTPIIQTPRKVSPNKVALVTTLQTPLVKVPRAVHPSLVALTTSLKTPVVKIGKRVFPSLLALTTSLKTPIVQTPRATHPTLDVLTTSLKSPKVQIGVRVHPAKANLTTSLKTPAVKTPIAVHPALIALVLTRHTPVIDISGSVSPPKATLFLNMRTPTVIVTGTGGGPNTNQLMLTGSGT